MLVSFVANLACTLEYSFLVGMRSQFRDGSCSSEIAEIFSTSSAVTKCSVGAVAIECLALHNVFSRVMECSVWRDYSDVPVMWQLLSHFAHSLEVCLVFFVS